MAMLPTLRVKRFLPEVKLPTRANPSDAGLDLYSPTATTIQPGELKTISLGIGVEVPEDMVGLLFPKSGLSTKFGTGILANVVDSGYSGEIHAVIVNHGDKELTINVGAKVCQLVVIPCLISAVEEVGELASSSRGEHRFGSSGVWGLARKKCSWKWLR